jgi:hypothetical protein
MVPVAAVKRHVTIRLDADVLTWFERKGKGYQTRINAALREYMNSHKRPNSAGDANHSEVRSWEWVQTCWMTRMGA